MQLQITKHKSKTGNISITQLNLSALSGSLFLSFLAEVQIAALCDSISYKSPQSCSKLYVAFPEVIKTETEDYIYNGTFEQLIYG